MTQGIIENRISKLSIMQLKKVVWSTPIIIVISSIVLVFRIKVIKMYEKKGIEKSRLYVLNNSIKWFFMPIGLTIVLIAEFAFNNVVEDLWTSEITRLIAVFMIIYCFLLVLIVLVFLACIFKKKEILAEKIGTWIIRGVWIVFILFVILTADILVFQVNTISIFLHLANLIGCLMLLIPLVSTQMQLRQSNTT